MYGILSISIIIQNAFYAEIDLKFTDRIIKHRKKENMSKVFQLKNGQSIIVTEDFIAISKKRFTDYEEMKKKANMLSLKDDFIKIEKRHAHEITYNKQGSKIKVLYSSETVVNASLKIEPKDDSELVEIAESVGQQLEMTRKEKDENKVKYAAINSLKVLLGVVVSVFLVNLSLLMKNGETIEVTGRRSGLKQMFIGIIEFLGPIGTSIICALVVGYLVYVTIKRFKNPSVEISFKKSYAKK